MLVEKGELTSGSTHHAAGLVTQFNPSPTMMRFRRYSVELYRQLGVFEAVGSLRIAASRESFLELRRGVSRAHGIGLDAELVGPDDVRRLLPAATSESLYGAVWMPGDGYVDPHIATYAVAGAARELGVELRIHSRVTGIELGPRREVRAVLDRARADRGGNGRQRGRDVGAADRSDGGHVRVLDPGRPPAHRAPRSRRAMSCRVTRRAFATPTTSSTGRPRAAACSSAATSRTPCRAGTTACPGSTAHACSRPTTRGSSS